MKAKIKLIKKEDRKGLTSAVEAETSGDPREVSTTVKSWVKEFQKDRLDESREPFDSLFTDSTS